MRGQCLAPWDQHLPAQRPPGAAGWRCSLPRAAVARPAVWLARERLSGRGEAAPLRRATRRVVTARASLPRGRPLPPRRALPGASRFALVPGGWRTGTLRWCAPARLAMHPAKDLASRAHARAKTKMFNRMQVVWLRDWGGEWCRDMHAVGAKVHGTLETTTRAHRARAPGQTRTSRSLRPLRIASRLGRGIRRHDRIARVLLFARFAAPCIHGCG